MGAKHTPDSAKREWQRLHGRWVRAIDANDKKLADRLLKRCDDLLPLFSKYWIGRTTADVHKARAALAKSQEK